MVSRERWLVVRGSWVRSAYGGVSVCQARADFQHGGFPLRLKGERGQGGQNEKVKFKGDFPGVGFIIVQSRSSFHSAWASKLAIVRNLR